ncbi:DUF2892 domain-containing protein [candidate division WWE3 bacterium]|nr:DUF2892 domain-containing protein [candidate division WWE3 bacterium]
MRKNIGTTDRIIRILIGVICLIAALILRNLFIAALGVFALYEGLASWCALYQLIGKNTCPIDLPSLQHNNSSKQQSKKVA